MTLASAGGDICNKGVAAAGAGYQRNRNSGHQRADSSGLSGNKRHGSEMARFGGHGAKIKRASLYLGSSNGIKQRWRTDRARVKYRGFERKQRSRIADIRISSKHCKHQSHQSARRSVIIRQQRRYRTRAFAQHQQHGELF